jgi:hypothetical protein
MATQSRIYVVKPKDGGAARLVRCTHPSHALKHVAEKLFTVGVATHDDLEALMPKTAVERINHEQQDLPT